MNGVTGAFADFLRAHRGELNARFAMARRRLPALEGAAFGAFLTSAVAPLVAAAPDPAVAHAAYEVALELCGQRLAGPGARDGRVGAAWAALLVPAAARIAERPEAALAAAANALVQLAAEPGARPDEWAGVMARVAARAASLDEWLIAGQVAGWRAGLAHYRASALDAADRLPPPLALELVGAASDWPALRARLRADPWHVPGAEPASGPRVVARVGAFRGFGGLFAVPPSVAGSGDRFLVASEEDAWVLFADAFGATFHRAADEDRRAAAASASEAPRWRGQRVEVAGQTIAVPVRGEVTSAAVAASTLAVTSSHSHALVLVALSR